MGVKISNLPIIVTPALTDVFPVVQSGVTYKESGTQLQTLLQANGEALTRVNDTNVTATLSGSPSTALLNAAEITLGWTGTLAASRGGTGLSSLGTGVAAALGESVNTADGLAVSVVDTFVPTLEFGGSSLGITYSDRRGHYVKVGRTVTFSIDFTLSSKGVQTGAATVSGLPFASLTNSTQTFATSQSLVTYTGIMISQLDGNDTVLSLEDLVSSTGEANLVDTAFMDTSVVRISGTYLTDV